MMPVVYCIGCVHYRPQEQPWCERPDSDECENCEYYCSWFGDERYPLFPDKYKPVPEK